MRPFAALAVLIAATPLAAQMVSIPLGGPRRERPSPNADLRGSPAKVVAAVALRGRPAASRYLDATRHPVEVLQFLGLALGARVLDVTDAGYYSEIIAAAVGPNGRVTALVPPATMTNPTSRRTMIDLVGRVPNVAIRAVDVASAPVAAGSVDFVLLDLAGRGPSGPAAGRTAPAAVLHALYAAVRPGGVIGIVDYGTARIDPAIVKADVGRAGFVFDGALALPGNRDEHGAPDPDGAIDRFVFRFVRPE